MISAPPESAWALCLPVSLVPALAPLRLCPGVEVGEGEPPEIWVRGRTADESLAAALRAVPATARFRWLPDGRLQPHGALLAAQKLPALTWQPLAAWLAFALPTARLPAARPTPVRLALRPSHESRPANAALLPLAAWLDWMAQAPVLRLNPLRFAATPAGQCLLIGTPLPPVPCRPCVEEAGVIVPAGLTWQPAVSAAVVRRVLAVPAEAIVLWDEAGVQMIGGELLVAASRGAVRATRAALASPEVL